MRSAPKRRGRNSRAAGLHARAQPVGSLFAIRERIVARSGTFIFRATGRNSKRGYERRRSMPAAGAARFACPRKVPSEPVVPCRCP